MRVTTPLPASLLILLLSFTIPVSIAAEETDPCEYTPQPDLLSVLASDSPTLAALRSADSLPSLGPAYQLFERIAAVVDARQSNNDSLACNLRKDDWAISSLITFCDRRIDALQLSDLCNTRVDLNAAMDRGELDVAFAASIKRTLQTTRSLLFDAITAADVAPKSRQSSRYWNRDIVSVQGWELSRRSQTCSVDSLFAYRIDDTWYLRAEATNSPVDAFMPESQRQHITEYIPRDRNESLRLRHPDYYADRVVSGSTFLEISAGKAGLSSTSNMTVDTNPALEEALRLNELAVDQAEDAVTLSNIAILALPLVLTLIPAAFVVDFNNCAMLAYIIFTDVFSALPFLIKGIELFQSATIRRGDSVAYHMGTPEMGQMEIWSAECRGEDTFRVLGIVFIIVAVIAIFFGIVTELVAAFMMRYRRAVKGHDARGPFGMAMFTRTSHALLGAAGDNLSDSGVEGDTQELSAGDFAGIPRLHRR